MYDKCLIGFLHLHWWFTLKGRIYKYNMCRYFLKIASSYDKYSWKDCTLAYEYTWHEFAVSLKKQNILDN